MRSISLAIIALALCLCAPAWAVDGVVEINQARALAGGVTAGDAPGFPVTIDAPGSYRLTGDLNVPGAEGGIYVEADNVTVDLNGFAIIGEVTCQGGGGAVNCVGPEGDDRDVGVFATGVSGLAVRNGSIRGGAGHCLNLNVENMLLEGLRVSDCRASGLVLRSSGAARDITVTRAANDGLFSAGVAVSRVHATNNGETGIRLAGGAQATDCMSAGNLAGFAGPAAGAIGAVAVHRSTAQLNAGPGFVQINLLTDSVAQDQIGSGFVQIVHGRGNVSIGNAQGPGTIQVQLGPNQCGPAPCP